MIDAVIEANVNGWATCPTVDKKPVRTGWGDAEPSAFIDEAEYTRTGEYLIVLRPTDLIIDVDPRNFPSGRKIWKEFIAAHGLDGIDKNTYVVKTGGGGYHIYLSKPADVLVRKHFAEWPGLDFLTGNKNAYVIGPGSKHKSGKYYEVARGKITDIKPAPEALISTIEKGKIKDETAQTKELSYSDDVQNIGRYTEYLKERAPVAIEGHAGDQTTFKVACRGRDYLLSPDKTIELMLTHYNNRCTPPWTTAELETKVRNAYKYNAEPVGKKAPEMAFNAVESGPDDTRYDPPVEGKKDWKMDAAGNPRPTLSNAVAYLSIHPEIHTNLRYSELSNDIEICGKLPWNDRRTLSKRWTDEDTIHLKYYMATITKTEFPTPVVMEAAYIVAARHMYHPVRDYLNKLKWDGKKRLDTWLIKYCNVVDEEYTRVIGRKTLVAAVTRAYRPGCEFHHVLVLEGAQGIGKSRAVAALGGEWFSDFHIDPANKDTVDAMRGKWIIEIPEMESIRGNKDMQLLKAFITRNEDRVRLAYARNTKDLPRRGIFIGTFNPDGIGYLTDSTGNRRFWPVLCTKTIDVDGIRQNRDQLFAEAVEAYKNGEPLHLTDDKIRREAEAQAEDRVEIDPWVEVISHWSNTVGKEVQSVSTADVFELVLHGTIKNISRLDQIRIGKALTLSGWHKKRVASGFLYYRTAIEKPMPPAPVPADVFDFTVNGDE